MSLNKHPFDWIIHALLCFIPIWREWATWFVVAFVAVLVEYEQWNCSGRPSGFWLKAVSDLIADGIGIAGSLYV